MKKHTFLTSLIACTALGFVPVAASAQQVVTSYSQNSQPQGQYQTSIIPQSAAIVVTFPNNVQFEVDEDESYPTTLLLAQPVLDSYGNVVAPANSPVQARIAPVDHEDGVQILVEALVAGGQAVSVKASSSPIPTQRVSRDDARERDQLNRERWGLVGAGLNGGLHGGNSQQFEAGGQLLGTIGALGNLFRSSRMNVAVIPQGSTYVLTLAAPVALPAMTMASAPLPPQSYQSPTGSASVANTGQPIASQQPSSGQAEFSFRNSLQYADTLEQVISAYQQGQITADEAHNRVEAADRFATTRLTQQLFPPAGVRQQIRQLFAFTYAIDR